MQILYKYITVQIHLDVTVISYHFHQFLRAAIDEGFTCAQHLTQVLINVFKQFKQTKQIHLKNLMI